jgi:hypothetical protein
VIGGRIPPVDPLREAVDLHICPLVADGGSVEIRPVMSSPMMHGA